MTDDLNYARECLANGNDAAATASALVGLLDLVVARDAQDSREEFLDKKWTECDAAIGRVLSLADELDAHPHATLKPTAFRDLAARIRAAIDGEDL